MTRIIMVRHGQSIANAQGRFAGHSDFDLTDLGRQQAECAAVYMRRKGIIPDAIYSSDLKRAHNTALPISKEFGLPINDTKHLREIFAGSWESMTVDEISEKYRDAFLTWKTDFSNARCTDGESVCELYDRIVPFVCELAAANDEKTLVLTTHATPVRAIDCFSRTWNVERIGEVSFVRNSAISIFNYENGVISPERVDIVDHLDPSLITGVHHNLNGTNKKQNSKV